MGDWRRFGDAGWKGICCSACVVAGPRENMHEPQGKFERKIKNFNFGDQSGNSGSRTFLHKVPRIPRDGG